MNIFVGNLNFQTTEKQLEDLFTPFGSIQSLKIIRGMQSGHSKGFAFIKMPVEAEAQGAVYALNNSSQDYHQITVYEAKAMNTTL
ncbi:MAG: RNA-binding protein [Sphingobacteriales bacterium]|nr:MAG: RNA-binding protein [Sphingobacteriales bacterium]